MISKGGREPVTKQGAGPPLRGILREQGRSAAWLARQLGITRAAVYLYCRTGAHVPRYRVEMIAEILGVPPALLRPEDVENGEKK